LSVGTTAAATRVTRAFFEDLERLGDRSSFEGQLERRLATRNPVAVAELSVAAFRRRRE
jgi:hypothetical protein